MLIGQQFEFFGFEVVVASPLERELCQACSCN